MISVAWLRKWKLIPTKEIPVHEKSADVYETGRLREENLMIFFFQKQGEKKVREFSFLSQ